MLFVGLKSPELHWNTAVSPATGNWPSGYALAAHQRQQPEEPNTSNQGRLDSVEPWGLSLWPLSGRIWVPSNKGPSCIYFSIAKAASVPGAQWQIPCCWLCLLALKLKKLIHFKCPSFHLENFYLCYYWDNLGTNIKITNLTYIQLCHWRG